MAHAVGIAANITIAAAYVTVFALVANGIRRQHQWRTNPLAVATAAIFFSCGVGHWLHVIHLVEGADPGYDWHLASWDTVTAAAGLTYVSLRSRFGLLLGDGRMFEDAQRLQADRQFRAAFEHAPIGMALVAPQGGGFERVNPALCTLMGRTEAELLATDFRSLTHPDDLDAGLELIQGLLRGDATHFRQDKRYLRPDGSVVFATLSVSLVRDEDGAPLHLISQVEDVTARREAETQLTAADARFRAAFENAPVGMALVDPGTGRLIRANPSLAALVGSHDPARPASEILHPADRRVARAAARSVLAHDAAGELDVRLVRQDGRQVDVSLALARVEDPGGAGLLIAHVLDVTERKRFEARLRHLADHDGLTGLLNRRRFEDLLGQTLAYRRRYGGTAALLLLDLDGFKDVNDTLGHAAGDGLLIRIGASLSSCLRDSDRLARLGGDEFAVLLPEADREAAEAVAAKLVEVVRQDVSPAEQRAGAAVTVSIGVTVVGGSATADTALVEADLALYAAKDAGRDGQHLFTPADAEGDRAAAALAAQPVTPRPSQLSGGR